MSLFLRTLAVLLRALLAPARDVMAESVLRFRVMPDDLDVNVHMNNGRYLALMDLGRFDVVVRAGLYRPLSHRRRWPVIGSALIRFRRSLRPFTAFELRTRVVGWDQRWMFFEQRFQRNGQVFCVALARGAFRSPAGTLSLPDVLREGGFSPQSPALPAHALAWAQADDAAYAVAVQAANAGPSP